MDRVGKLEQVQEPCYIIVNKIKIFKEAKDTNIGHNTHSQVPLSSGTSGFFNQDAGKIIYHYSKCQDKNIDRDKVHVEKTTTQEQ